MNWTNEQRAAIEDEGGTLLVSAAAGSGKTAVLVQRAVRLLTQESAPIPADRLLIVTFTRAAAEEMRARIASSLAQQQAADPKNMRIRRQILLLGRANICTIDAFCMQLLRLHFMRANIAPDFDMADKALAGAMRQKALEEVLEELYTNTDFCEFASMYGRSRSDSTAVAALMGLCSYLESIPFPKAALRSLVADWSTQQPLTDTKWGAVLAARGVNIIDSALSIDTAAYNEVRREEALGNYQSAFEDDIAYLNMMRELLLGKQWDKAVSKARAHKPASLKPVRGYEGTLMDTVKSLRDKVKAMMKDLADKVLVCTESEFAEDRIRTLPMLTALTSGAERLLDALMRIKQEQKTFEFYDLEQMALNLLCNENYERSELSYTVAAGFDAVMVDEYQDTNELQSLLYTCLANEDQSNLFMVGDVKQSIYRFRLAQPEIFIAKKSSYHAYSTHKHPAVLNLGANFRSSSGVIDEVNYIFSVLMSPTLGGVEYNDAERLNVGVQDSYAPSGMSLALVETENGITAGDSEYIADTIESMVNDGFLVRDKSGERACNYGDFCILLRTRGDFAVYSAALETRGIQTFTDTDFGLLSLPEISPLMSLLRIIDNPMQDVHLTAVMLSLLYDFTPSMLMHLREAQRKGSMYSAVLQDKSEPSRRFVADLAAYRRLAVTCSCEEVYWEVFARTRYFEKIGAVKQGGEKRDNVRAFVAYVNSACKGASGISGFLRTLDLGEDLAGTSATAPVAQPNTVSIMTIHRSKGLEFPIVILANADHGFNMREASQALLSHAHLGAALTLKGEGGGLYRSAAHIAIGTAIRNEAVSEEMRVLYVALTRAKDKLIITIPMSEPTKRIKDIAIMLAGTRGVNRTVLASANSYAQWICTAALMHPDCDNLRAIAQGVICPVLDTNSHISAQIITSVGAKEQQARAKPERPAADEALVSRLCESFAQERAGRQGRIDIPTKISVSRLVHNRVSTVLTRPSFAYVHSATAAQKGTALHSFMQYADLLAASESLDAELKRLVLEQYLEPEIALLLDREAISGFLASKLAARMLSCDRLLREYDFITALPPERVVGESADVSEAQAVLVQGIADAVLITANSAEIVDYKTDKVASEQALIDSYAPQLLLYKTAIALRLGVEVTALTIYSFALGREVKVL